MVKSSGNSQHPRKSGPSSNSFSKETKPKRDRVLVTRIRTVSKSPACISRHGCATSVTYFIATDRLIPVHRKCDAFVGILEPEKNKTHRSIGRVRKSETVVAPRVRVINVSPITIAGRCRVVREFHSFPALESFGKVFARVKNYGVSSE